MSEQQHEIATVAGPARGFAAALAARLGRTGTLLAALTLVGGCSATALVYDNAPWLIQTRVEDYFSLSDEQEAYVEASIRELAVWHRREELPRYARALERLERDFADGISAAEYDAMMGELYDARSRIGERSLPAIARFLAGVTPQQIDEYDEAFREALEEDRERLELSPEERRERRFERLLDNLEDWFDDLDDRQIARLRELSYALPDNYGQWLAYRERRHEDFLALLRRRPGADAIEAWLRAQWIERDRHAHDPQYAALRERFRADTRAMLLEMDKVLNARQRQHAIARLAGYRRDLAELSVANVGHVPVRLPGDSK